MRQMARLAGLLVLASLLGRLAVYFGLTQMGWFYGTPWDTFSRTYLAWQWAQRPFFAAGDIYWLPLQFWVVGAAYAVLRPLTGNSSELLVPVAVNNVFLAGSLAVTALTAAELGGPAAALVACLLAVTFAPDVWVSYSGLAEPIYIFAILLASRLMLRHYGRPGLPVALGGVALLAAATHYLGWFLAAFCGLAIGLRLVLLPAARRGWGLGLSLAGLLMCGLFPSLWLYVNWRAWGDSLHFVRVAAGYQAPYAGSLGLAERLAAPAPVVLEVLGPLGPAILVGVVGVLVRRREAAWYLVLGLWILGLVWLATAAGLAAPFQEPRYLAFLGWLAFPFVGAFAARLWDWGRPAGLVGAAAVCLLAAAGLWQTFSFSNSFGPDLAEVSRRAGAFLRQNPTAAVVVEVDSLKPLANYGERGVLPIAAGFPDRFDFVVGQAPGAPELMLALARSGDLVVTASRTAAELAAGSGLDVEVVGRYFLIAGDRRGTR